MLVFIGQQAQQPVNGVPDGCFIGAEDTREDQPGTPWVLVRLVTRDNTVAMPFEADAARKLAEALTEAAGLAETAKAVQDERMKALQEEQRRRMDGGPFATGGADKPSIFRPQ